MPAVQLSILKKQIDDLIWKYTQPELFSRQLHDLLSHYANRVFRGGKNSKNVYKGNKYNSPKFIIDQIIVELNPLVIENPDRLISLADRLWTENYLEFKLISISILGKLPPSHFEDVLSHIQNWAENISSSLLIEKLLYDASKNIRFNNIDQWLDQIYSWLNNPNTKFHSIGLKATLPLISDNTFENFPPLFAMITPYFQKDNYYVQNELYSILSGLIIRSPVETSYFFKQILSSGISKVHLRTIRKFLPKFDKNTQETIRDSINNAVINENQ